MGSVMHEIYYYMSFINRHLENEEDYNPRWLDSMLDILEELHKVQPVTTELPEDFYEKLSDRRP